MKLFGAVFFVFISYIAFAQPPLSKKNQKVKAEFEAQIVAEKKYEELVSNADAAFKRKEYLLARMTYQDAIQYNQEMEQWLVSKVNDLDILMAKNVAREVDSILVKVPMKTAELGISNETVNISSRTLDNNIPKITSAEDDTILIEAEVVKQEVNPPVIKQEERVVQPKPVVKTVIPIEPKMEKVKEDFSHLSDGIAEETFTLPNHEVLRVIVKEGIDVKVFKRVKHNWGGEFYFLDDMDVSKRYWMEQVDSYRLKYAKSGE